MPCALMQGWNIWAGKSLSFKNSIRMIYQDNLQYETFSIYRYTVSPPPVQRNLKWIKRKKRQYPEGIYFIRSGVSLFPNGKALKCIESVRIRHLKIPAMDKHSKGGTVSVFIFTRSTLLCTNARAQGELLGRFHSRRIHPGLIIPLWQK